MSKSEWTAVMVAATCIIMVTWYCATLRADNDHLRNQIKTYGEFMQSFDPCDINGDNLHDVTGEFMD